MKLTFYFYSAIFFALLSPSYSCIGSTLPSNNSTHNSTNVHEFDYYQRGDTTHAHMSRKRIKYHRESFAVERHRAYQAKQGLAALSAFVGLAYTVVKGWGSIYSQKDYSSVKESSDLIRATRSLSPTRSMATNLVGYAASTAGSFLGYRFLESSPVACTIADFLVEDPSLFWYIRTHSSLEQYAEDLVRLAQEHESVLNGTGNCWHCQSLRESYDALFTAFSLFVKHFEKVLGYISYSISMENFTMHDYYDQQRARQIRKQLLRLGDRLSFIFESPNTSLERVPEVLCVNSLITAIRAELRSFTALEKQ
jgi:hypothetical protein